MTVTDPELLRVLFENEYDGRSWKFCSLWQSSRKKLLPDYNYLGWQI